MGGLGRGGGLGAVRYFGLVRVKGGCTFSFGKAGLYFGLSRWG